MIERRVVFGRFLPCLLAGAALFGTGACQNLERFDTNGAAAYCGSIVDAKFVRTPNTQGGFDRTLKVKLKLDTGNLSTTPGAISTNDADGGACAPDATFHNTKLVVTPEVVNDPLSTLTFEDGQVHNIVAWVESSCRGKMLAVVSLYKSNHVEVRLLRPGSGALDSTDRDAFALFQLDRSDDGCGPGF